MQSRGQGSRDHGRAHPTPTPSRLLLCRALNGALESFTCCAQFCSSPLEEHVLYLSLFTKDQTLAWRQSRSPASPVSENLRIDWSRLFMCLSHRGTKPLTLPGPAIPARCRAFVESTPLLRAHRGAGVTCLASLHVCSLCPGPGPVTLSAGRCLGSSQPCCPRESWNVFREYGD